MLPCPHGRRARVACLPVIAALVLPIACGTATAPADGRAGGASAAVRTTGVARISVQRQIDLAGTLMSPDQARVSSEAAGVVRRVLVEIGRPVAVGTPLVELETRELELALRRAESALRQTRAQLGMPSEPLDGDDAPPADEEIASVKTATATREEAHAAYQRAKALNGRGIVSPEALQAAETRSRVAEASYQAALDSARSAKAMLQDRRAAYELAVKQLRDGVVRAPIAGVVSDRPVQVGEYISARTPVATIVQMHPLKLRTGVQERHAGVVRVGQRVEFRVESYGERLFSGRVAYISPALDQTMRTFAVEALVDNDDLALKPGFFAKGVILTTRDENVLAVPDAAVSVLAGVSSVYVITDGTITQQSVTLGVRQGDLWEVSAGLKGDELLATSRLNELATGVKVRTLKEGEAEGAAPRSGPAGQRPQGGQR